MSVIGAHGIGGVLALQGNNGMIKHIAYALAALLAVQILPDRLLAIADEVIE
jgi:hypothetical protein